MCYPTGARPPDVPSDLLPPMTGGAGGQDVILTSADGTKFRAYLAKASTGDAGVVIAPDVRGLHPFYEELAERFASAGVHAIAFINAKLEHPSGDLPGDQSGPNADVPSIARQDHSQELIT